MTLFSRVLLATSNPGKVRELQRLLGEVVEVVTLDAVATPPTEPEETGDTFASNAIIKALAYGRAAGVVTLADDSGLVVDALDGAPGVYSARFAGPEADDADNNALLLERLEAVGDEARTARFRCVVALYLPASFDAEAASAVVDAHPALTMEAADGGEGEHLVLASGAAEGRILHEPRGEGGFGYDPLFASEDLGVTFAEATMADKSAVSHRGRAFAALVPLLLHAG